MYTPVNYRYRIAEDAEVAALDCCHAIHDPGYTALPSPAHGPATFEAEAGIPGPMARGLLRRELPLNLLAGLMPGQDDACMSTLPT